MQIEQKTIEEQKLNIVNKKASFQGRAIKK